jgi:HNH endonuclease/AP2 domain
MMAIDLLSELKKSISYNPTSGKFTWLIARGPAIRGAEAGCLADRGNGYKIVLIGLNRKLYRAHRLAWLFVYGKWPKGRLDHRDGDPTNNRISNLREATQSQNMGNSKKPNYNTSGLKGVFWHARACKWSSQIRADGKKYHLGLFETKEASHLAYKSAAIKHHGEFARWE